MSGLRYRGLFNPVSNEPDLVNGTDFEVGDVYYVTETGGSDPVFTAGSLLIRNDSDEWDMVMHPHIDFSSASFPASQIEGLDPGQFLMNVGGQVRKVRFVAGEGITLSTSDAVPENLVMSYDANTGAANVLPPANPFGDNHFPELGRYGHAFISVPQPDESSKWFIVGGSAEFRRRAISNWFSDSICTGDLKADCLMSTDKGKTWSIQNANIFGDSADIQGVIHAELARIGSVLYLVGGIKQTSSALRERMSRGNLWRSDDDGVTWTEMTNPVFEESDGTPASDMLNNSSNALPEIWFGVHHLPDSFVIIGGARLTFDSVQDRDSVSARLQDSGGWTRRVFHVSETSEGKPKWVRHTTFTNNGSNQDNSQPVPTVMPSFGFMYAQIDNNTGYVFGGANRTAANFDPETNDPFVLYNSRQQTFRFHLDLNGQKNQMIPIVNASDTAAFNPFTHHTPDRSMLSAGAYDASTNTLALVGGDNDMQNIDGFPRMFRGLFLCELDSSFQPKSQHAWQMQYGVTDTLGQPTPLANFFRTKVVMEDGVLYILFGLHSRSHMREMEHPRYYHELLELAINDAIIEIPIHQTVRMASRGDPESETFNFELNGPQTVYAMVPRRVPQHRYFGRNGTCEFVIGNCPIILSVPHGGYWDDRNMIFRDSTDTLNIATPADRFTIPLALQMAQTIEAEYGVRPYLVINYVDRKYLDMNRHIYAQAEGPTGELVSEPTATHALSETYFDYMTFLFEAIEKAHEDYGHSMTFDIHGHGKDTTIIEDDTTNMGFANWIEVGYNLSRFRLRDIHENPDAPNSGDPILQTQVSTVRNPTRVVDPSVRELYQSSKQAPMTFHDFFLGNDSLGKFLQDQDLRSIPSPADPFSVGPFFPGGPITDLAGSSQFTRYMHSTSTDFDPSWIDLDHFEKFPRQNCIQLEINGDRRFGLSERVRTSKRVSHACMDYLRHHLDDADLGISSSL